MIANLEKQFKKIQATIHNSFDQLEGSNKADTSKDSWKRPEGGGGKTIVIAGGNFFDNCAINYSSIFGKKLPKAALANSINKNTKYGYQAMGISVISHPINPHIPSSHMNIRFFGILDKKGDIKDWWIGGGYDLTPYIPHKEDILSWHSSAKESLDVWDTNFYKIFSDNCNNYFNIPHRNERRGIGGIFFDNLSDFNIDDSVNFLKSVAQTYLDSYLNIINNRKVLKFTKEEKDFQLIRRGRYVEFNLIYDRGTAFGLQSNGRIESILASLPSDVKWAYKKNKEYKDLEKKLLKFINRDWNV
ncbi:MAG: oxygen-dependent coproporphyrinogen oxidase [Gammaproteobacteria bacterium]|nr:oxygen-dependent coproporphyrinogen oxidase [Gammaproteobacteria bacterium]